MKKEKKKETPSHSSFPRHSIATNQAPIPIQTWKVRKGHLAPTQNNLLFFLFIFNFFSILFGFSLRFLVLYFAWVKFFEFIKNCKNNNKMIYTVFICENRQWKDTTPIPCTQTILVYCWYYELNKIPTANQKTQKLIIDSLSLERERWDERYFHIKYSQSCNYKFNNKNNNNNEERSLLLHLSSTSLR